MDINPNAYTSNHKGKDHTMTTVPKDRLVRVTFDVRLPIAATRDEIDDWIGHMLQCSGISIDNPLTEYEPEAFADEYLLTDTGLNGYETETLLTRSNEHPARSRRTYMRVVPQAERNEP